MGTIAESYSGEYRFRFFGTEGKKELAEFLKTPGYASYVEINGVSQRATDVDVVGPLFASGSNVYRLSTAPFETKLLWNARTSDGHDCVVEATILVEADQPRFWEVWSAATRANGSLESSSIENRLIDELKAEIVDEIKNHTFDALTCDDVLPRAWFADFFQTRVERSGLKFDSVVKVVYAAPTLEKKREMEKRDAERRELLELTKANFEFEESKRELEQDAFCANCRRQEERERLEEQAIERAEDAEMKRLAHKRAKLELEVEIGEIESRPEKLKAIQEELRHVHELIKQVVEFNKARQEASKTNSAPSAQLAAFLSGISDEALFKLGLCGGKAFFSRYFNARVREEPSKKVRVRLEKSFPTRSVTYKKDILSLHIEDSLALEIVSPIDGYISVLNLGTSNDYWLLTPNNGVAPTEARVGQGEKVNVPGDKLYRGDLFEGGPKGWEEFVVIVSKEPLFDDSERFNAVEPENPFVELSTERLNRLLGRLATFDAQDWAVGTLGVNVVD